MSLFLSGLSAYSDWGLLILRIVIGAIFLYHCQMKFKYLPSPFGFLGIAELLGGIAMIVGFLTPLAATGLGIVMLGAIYMKTIVWNVPFSAMDKTGWELDSMILAGCIALLLFGAGAYSADASIFAASVY